jgi:hypothetical protein
MLVHWIAYAPGDDVGQSPSGQYWLYLRPFGQIGSRVSFGTREYNGSLTYIWRTEDIGGCDDLVTHYAPMEWPEPPERWT